MRTLEEISKTYNLHSNELRPCLDNRDLYRLMKFIPEEDLPKFGMELKDEFKGKHKHIKFNRCNVLSQLKRDVSFGFEKALNKRGISAGLMYEVVHMWNWILEDGLEDFDAYAQYGLPLFKATALKYGFPNPIGDDQGDEYKYSAEAEGE